MGIIVKKNASEAGIEARHEPAIWLFEEHTFGRDSRCIPPLQGHAASRFHARISWNGREWTLRDLGSRNGTYLNGRRQVNGESKSLKVGDRILFGDLHEEYQLVDQDEPRSLLIRRENDRETRIPMTHLLPLPSMQRPLCTVFCEKSQNCGLETETGEMLPLVHGGTFNVEETVYQVVMKNQVGEFPQTGSSELGLERSGVHLEIAVSPDEECAEIVLHRGPDRLALAPKAHFYLLAHLARLRLAQTPEATCNPSSPEGDDNGWIDCETVCKALMINREHLAQQVFRIRQEFKSCDPVLAEHIIERRLRGKMRIGVEAKNLEVRTMR